MEKDEQNLDTIIENRRKCSETVNNVVWSILKNVYENDISDCVSSLITELCGEDIASKFYKQFAMTSKITDMSDSDVSFKKEYAKKRSSKRAARRARKAAASSSNQTMSLSRNSSDFEAEKASTTSGNDASEDFCMTCHKQLIQHEHEDKQQSNNCNPEYPNACMNTESATDVALQSEKSKKLLEEISAGLKHFIQAKQLLENQRKHTERKLRCNIPRPKPVPLFHCKPNLEHNVRVVNERLVENYQRECNCNNFKIEAKSVISECKHELERCLANAIKRILVNKQIEVNEPENKNIGQSKVIDYLLTSPDMCDMAEKKTKTQQAKRCETQRKPPPSDDNQQHDPSRREVFETCKEMVRKILSLCADKHMTKELDNARNDKNQSHTDYNTAYSKNVQQNSAKVDVKYFSDAPDDKTIDGFKEMAKQSGLSPQDVDDIVNSVKQALADKCRSALTSATRGTCSNFQDENGAKSQQRNQRRECHSVLEYKKVFSDSRQVSDPSEQPNQCVTAKNNQPSENAPIHMAFAGCDELVNVFCPHLVAVKMLNSYHTHDEHTQTIGTGLKDQLITARQSAPPMLCGNDVLLSVKSVYSQTDKIEMRTNQTQPEYVYTERQAVDSGNLTSRQYNYHEYEQSKRSQPIVHTEILRPRTEDHTVPAYTKTRTEKSGRKGEDASVNNRSIYGCEEALQQGPQLLQVPQPSNRLVVNKPDREKVKGFNESIKQQSTEVTNAGSMKGSYQQENFLNRQKTEYKQKTESISKGGQIGENCPVNNKNLAVELNVTVVKSGKPKQSEALTLHTDNSGKRILEKTQDGERYNDNFYDLDF